ncbi:hypothetical protein PENSPDRAFT_26779 [Peniophora sp. CONT]|nr:hypothetical protein PENSPDRAFT_26779 [Peniophora sp. CONT]
MRCSIETFISAGHGPPPVWASAISRANASTHHRPNIAHHILLRPLRTPRTTLVKGICEAVFDPHAYRLPGALSAQTQAGEIVPHAISRSKNRESHTSKQLLQTHRLDFSFCIRARILIATCPQAHAQRDLAAENCTMVDRAPGLRRRA